MKHSLIVPYRNRADALKLWLRSLEDQANTDWEFILVELSDKPTDLDPYWNENTPIDFAIDHVWVVDGGIFNRSRALNEGVKNSSGEFLTFGDIDCLPERPDHFFDIKQWYSVPSNASMRLGHQVRWLDDNIVRTARLRNPTDPYAFLLDRAFPDLDRYKNCFGLVEHDGRCLGNSHFTISRDQFEDLGGFDERFIGYGWEDIEFNRRYYQHYKQPTIMEGGRMWHIAHPRNQDPDYDSDQITQANSEHFREVEAAGFPKLKGARPCADTSDKSPTNTTTTAKQFSS